MSEHLPLQRIRSILLAVIALVCLGFVLYVAKSVILPFLLAFFAMTILSPLVVWLGKRGVPTWIGAPLALVIMALFLGVAGFIFFLNIGPIVKAWPQYQDRGNELIQRGATRLENWNLKDDVIRQWNENKDKIKDPTPFISFGTGGVMTLWAFLGQAILVLLFLMFMLFEAARFHEKTEKAFGENNAILDTVRCISHDVKVYMFWKTLVSLATGFLTSITCLIFGLDFPFFWGLLAFGLNFIPNLGSVVASVLPCLLALFLFDSPFYALGLLVVLIVMQNVMGSVIEPKLMGDSLSISPLVLLLSLVFWGWLWGVVGMMLAVPFAVTIKICCQHMPGLKPLGTMMEA